MKCSANRTLASLNWTPAHPQSPTSPTCQMPCVLCCRALCWLFHCIAPDNFVRGSFCCKVESTAIVSSSSPTPWIIPLSPPDRFYSVFPQNQLLLSIGCLKHVSCIFLSFPVCLSLTNSLCWQAHHTLMPSLTLSTALKLFL